MPTITRMGDKKHQKKSGGSGKYKPFRPVRIPIKLADLIQECADEDGENFAFEVRAACRMYLQSRGKLPKPD